MSLSFEDSLEKMQEQSVSEDNGNWIEHDKYKYYNDYSDNNISTIDGNKNILLNNKQFNITQEESSQFIPFEMPRYYDGFDLTSTTLSIHYETQDGYHGASDPVNVIYNDEKIRFAWLIDANVTHVAGKIKFEIHAIGINSNGDAYVWKSKTNGSLNVSQSLCIDCEDIIVLDDSWVQQLVTKVVEQIADAQIEEHVAAAQNAAISAEEYAGQAKTYADKAESIFKTPIDEILFIDGTTGSTYRLYVDNGKLSMTEIIST